MKLSESYSEQHWTTAGRATDSVLLPNVLAAVFIDGFQRGRLYLFVNVWRLLAGATGSPPLGFAAPII